MLYLGCLTPSSCAGDLPVTVLRSNLTMKPLRFVELVRMDSLRSRLIWLLIDTDGRSCGLPICIHDVLSTCN